MIDVIFLLKYLYVYYKYTVYDTVMIHVLFCTNYMAYSP